MTQYSMDPVAKLGLLKMDFLGLTNLTILDRAVKLLDETRGINIDVGRLPLDDPETFELLSSGKTTDLFQLESAGMQRYIKELKPSNLGDIAAMIALYRPGPMEHIDAFINAKHGRAPISYPHPSLKELLDETYGVIVYQDQVLLILQNFAGYTLGEADTVRKAMGKKIASLMAEERDRFVGGAQSKGFDKSLAVQVFDLIEPFAGYAFNKAHSVSYALISYWTAFFKAHYPLEYMASVLNSRLDHPDKVVSSINECSKMGIPVLLPDVNSSGEYFTIDKDNGPTTALRFGLAAVKTVGEGAVRPIVEEQKKGGPYQSIDDFCRRADVSNLNRRTLESLVKAGAFDALGSRGTIYAALDRILATAQLETRTRNSGQTSMFDALSAGTAGTEIAGIDLSGADVSLPEKAGWERELLGVSLSHNPLFDLAYMDVGDAINSLDQLDDDMQGLTLSLVGHVSTVSERYTREQKKFFIVSLDLLGGPVEAVVWPDVLERTQHLWEEGKLVKTSGKLRIRGDRFSLSCEQVEVLESVPSPAQDRTSDTPPPVEAASEPPPDRKAAPATVPSPTPVNGNKGRNGSNGNDASNVHNGSKGISRTVSLGIHESEDPVEDAHLLREVVRLLLEYPGDDRVNLEIHMEERRVLMDLPVVSISYCDPLRGRLEELLGPNAVHVSPNGGTAEGEATT
jgi:DNA polymerase-3 subunit alpha